MGNGRHHPHRRYRRRILGWGAVVLVVLFVVASLVMIPWVERDLERRAGEELDAAGFIGVSLSFSGQDATLSCVEALDEPGDAVDVVEAVWGVRTAVTDGSCTGSGPDGPAGTDQASTSTVPDDVVTTDGPAPTASSTTTTVPDDATTTTAPDQGIGTVTELIRQDPQFSQLAELLTTTNLDLELAGDGPFTVFAPTDVAFDELFDLIGADDFGALSSDPDRLAILLAHHVTPGTLTSADLVDGELEMLDGSGVEVAVDNGVTLTSGDSVAVVDDPERQLDIPASNGVVHAIDSVLVPPGFDLEGEEEEPVDEAPAVTTTVTYVDGVLTLSGSVATEAQRTSLLEAVATLVDPANVADLLVVDPEAAVTDDDVGRLAAMVAVIPPNLIGATATLAPGAVSVTGTHLGPEALAAVETVAAGVTAELDLSPRPTADPDAAATLQDDLNAFVAANPILFEPNSAELGEGANAVIEQVAARAVGLDGVTITIVGHTDTDGDPVANQLLSEDRAATVLVALAARGVDPAALASVGRGGTEPVLDASGEEDKAASRRVEFLVEVRG